MDNFIPLAQQLFQVIVTSRQQEQFLQYKELLQTHNKVINLTRLITDEDIMHKHFLDSMSAVLALSPVAFPKRCLDVGSGAGFPGLVLKILYPDMHLTLLETVGKKAQFCALVAEKLALSSVEVLTKRAEEVGKMAEYRESYDLVVSRAVAALPILVEYMLPLVQVDGVAVAYKGAKSQDELIMSQSAITKLGGVLSSTIPVMLATDTNPRSLVVIKKTSHTPALYPRSTQEIIKSPLIADSST